MIPRLRFALVLILVTSAAGLAVAGAGCGSDTTSVGGGATDDAPSSKPDSTSSDPDATTTGDAAKDAPSSVDASDGGTNGKGETCVGFAKAMPCGVGGLPDFGYVCFNGSPPGIAGCALASSTGSFGDTYCCTENKCVAQPDQDKECKTAQAPHRFQCPPNGSGGSVAPAASCVDAGGGGSALERFYCCP
jgi:hypothetical protein